MSQPQAALWPRYELLEPLLAGATVHILSGELSPEGALGPVGEGRVEGGVGRGRMLGSLELRPFG